MDTYRFANVVDGQSSTAIALALVLVGLLAWHEPVQAIEAAEARCPDGLGWTQLALPDNHGKGDIPADLLDVAASSLAVGWIYAADSRGLYRSDDCGATWKAVSMGPSLSTGGQQPFTGPVRSLAFVHPQHLYVGADYQPMMSTSDGGATWNYGKELIGQSARRPEGWIYAHSRVIVASPSN